MIALTDLISQLDPYMPAIGLTFMVACFLGMGLSLDKERVFRRGYHHSLWFRGLTQLAWVVTTITSILLVAYTLAS